MLNACPVVRRWKGRKSACYFFRKLHNHGNLCITQTYPHIPGWNASPVSGQRMARCSCQQHRRRYEWPLIIDWIPLQSYIFTYCFPNLSVYDQRNETPCTLLLFATNCISALYPCMHQSYITSRKSNESIITKTALGSIPQNMMLLYTFITWWR